MHHLCKKMNGWQWNPKNLQAPHEFTTVLSSSDWGCWQWVGFFCMKATWHAASLMKFVLSMISNLQGCCHPRGSEQQDLFASTPTGKNKQQPWAPALAGSREQHGPSKPSSKKTRTSRAEPPPHLGALNFIKAQNKFRLFPSRKSPQSCKTSCLRCQKQPQQHSLLPSGSVSLHYQTPMGLREAFLPPAPPGGLIPNLPAPTQGLISEKRFTGELVFPCHLLPCRNGVGRERFLCCWWHFHSLISSLSEDWRYFITSQGLFLLSLMDFLCSPPLPDHLIVQHPENLTRKPKASLIMWTIPK